MEHRRPAHGLNERAGAQAHFIDLCRLLGVPEPGDPGAYCFERGVTKTGSAAVEGRHRSDGFADVWLKGGFVATNSIRQSSNRQVLESICDSMNIFEAWDDMPWVNDGAAVRVSLVCFGTKLASVSYLNGREVGRIGPDLSEVTPASDFRDVLPLAESTGASFQGSQKIGAFDIPGDLARRWLGRPNPNGRPNSDVVRPLFNGIDVTRRTRDMWVVDFGTAFSHNDAALFEEPYQHVLASVKPERDQNAREAYRRFWWRHGEPRVGMRRALAGIQRCAAISEKSKHFFFVWLRTAVLPDKRLIVVARADEATFGILSSRLHRLWSLRLGSTLEDRPCYTPTTCFETFPFPEGLTPAHTAHQRTQTLEGGAVIPADLPAEVQARAAPIARAAQRLVALRDAWLNPPEWTERLPEVVPLGMTASPYPDRIVAKPGHEKDLAKRTLTNLYNQRPAWLAHAHEALDAAVAAAYGWADYTSAMPDEEVLRRLLALNLARAT